MEQDATRARATALVQQATADLPPAEAAVALAELATRALAELQRVARQEATARRGQPAWGGWAKLQAAARKGILDTASCRDAARALDASAGEGSAGD